MFGGKCVNRNIVKLVVFMLILVVAVAGCGQKDTEEKTEMTTIKDELGTEIIKKILNVLLY